MVNIMSEALENKSILLIISGGIAAYKSLELIRLLRKSGATVRCILTQGGSQFVTPFSVSALSEHPVYSDLWSLKDESEMGHIRLSREADLIVIAPASANIIAKMAHGLADDLASTTLLAANKPILIAPAMNVAMWHNPATQHNIKTLTDRGIRFIGPDEGAMACGEFGLGRMSEPEDIFKAIQSFFFDRPLKGLKAIITSGPTFEAIDPVRFLGNRSSGKQGHAIASALEKAGAHVTLISGPVSIPAPANVTTIAVESAQDMLKACEAALPADIAICAAAVSDWRALEPQASKIKKSGTPPALNLIENPDILQTLSKHSKRPHLVVGFAAETENLMDNARAKLIKKSCDWILANDVAAHAIFGSDETHLHLICTNNAQDWGVMSKTNAANRLTQEIISHFG
jgi:phosphopantothenoylcysteine decarboxylase/phosphopantothenate--cysteine ligase